MKTKQAFKKLLDDPELYSKLNMEQYNIRKLRQRLGTNKVTLDTMEKLLKKAGAKKIPESWEFK